MKILVPVKRVPNPDEPIRVRHDGTGIDQNNITFVINPFDAIALEESLQIRERSDSAVDIVTVSLGPPEVESELRTALAMGADRAIRIESEPGLDPWSVACVLTALVSRESPDLVLMGKQAVDDDFNQTGQMLAALLGWPQATFASQIEFLSDGRLKVAREIDQGLESIAIRLPAVVTTDLRLNEPRYASLPALMKSKKRPIEYLSLTELGVSIESRVQVMRVEQSAINRSCMAVSNVEELVHHLRYEAKVL